MTVEARLWHRLLSPLAALALVLTVAAGPAHAVDYYPASVYSNITAFNVCVGYTDTAPAVLRDMARDGFAFLGYATTAYSGKSFTKAAVLAHSPTDIGFYVHSHGDLYGSNAIQGFREDGGDCSQPVIYATEIKKARTTPEGRLILAKLVIMSTCHLAEAPRNGFPAMSEAFGIERVKSDPTGAGYRGPEFFLGYRGVAWVADQVRFEAEFWDDVRSHFSLGDAFRLALASNAIRYPTVPDWFGSFTFSGRAQPTSPCTTCQ
ncbi:MAG: hypothetical protein ACRDF7_03365 [Candidatus Limnocylindrales bacterium]